MSDKEIKLSIVMPCYNERATIREILRRVSNLNVPKEIIVVDDHSTDGTREILKKIEKDGQIENLKIAFHEKNMGKGAALRTGFSMVKGEITAVQDADLEYDPAEIPKLMEPILDGRADVVFGSRFAGGSHRVLFFWHMTGNKFLTFLSNMFTNLNLTDMETCYKVFRTDILKKIKLVSNRFGFEPEFTQKVARLGCKIWEMPVTYSGRDYTEGKKITWKDGIAALYTIVRHGLLDDTPPELSGFYTLQNLRRSEKASAFIYSAVKPYLGESIVEIGARAGHITRFLAQQGRKITACEGDPENFRTLEKLFKYHGDVTLLQSSMIEAVTKVNITQNDTVVMINSPACTDDDKLLSELSKNCPEGTAVVVTLPAHPSLFGALDRSLGYKRRYSKHDIKKLAEKYGFEIEIIKYFNSLSYVGWLAASKVLKRKKIGKFSIAMFNIILPFIKIIDSLRPPFGLSLLAVMRKKRS